MKIENLDFPEAVLFLAQKLGISVPEDDAQRNIGVKRDRLYAVNKEAALFFHESLLSEEGKTAQTYLEKRGILPKTVKHFGLGFSFDAWDRLLKTLLPKGFSYEEMNRAGLVVKNAAGRFYDRFRNRVMFPIIDLRGNVIAFGGRVMDDSLPKYLNSPDTPVFNKSHHLFAMNFAKNNAKDGMILSEGYMDVVAMHQAGFTNAVASLGTSFTDAHAKLIMRYTKEVVLSFDSDEAGKKAARKAIQIFEDNGVKARVLPLSGAKDPDEYIKKFGRDRFALLIKDSKGAVDYLFSQSALKFDLSDTAQKAEFLKEIIAILAGIQSAVERELYIEKASNLYGVSKESLAFELKKILRKKESKYKKEFPRKLLEGKIPGGETLPRTGKNLKAKRAGQALIALVFKDHALLSLLTGKLQPGYFLDETDRKIFETLAQRIQNDEPCDAIALSGQLTAEEISELCGVVSREYPFDDNRKAVLDLLETMRFERERNCHDINTGEWDLEKWYEAMKTKKSGERR